MRLPVITVENQKSSKFYPPLPKKSDVQQFGVYWLVRKRGVLYVLKSVIRTPTLTEKRGEFNGAAKRTKAIGQV